MTLIRTAAAATAIVGALSFWLSFTALADLARQSGFHGAQAYAWPVIVDGLVVIATIALKSDVRSLPWTVLTASAAISVAGNGLHAWRLTHSPVAVAVSLVPPLAVLTATVLCDRLFRAAADASQKADQPKHADTQQNPNTDQEPTPMPAWVQPVLHDARVAPKTEHLDDPATDNLSDVDLALKLADEGMSNYDIGSRVGKSEATIRRWRKAHE